ncbi:membrane protein [Mycobacterium sp. MFM001]|uniref:MmpS family transport accessory protein n=1 Tax=Mycobacterium sp. MFM001 TaxID=2049453 RepID=UPI000DA46AB3|nr:MmpS family transport accessory protein [Mycobacterium sp. MFM001]GBE64219.1 membrane protein [Mycobacterium sp. MFM001]
MYRLLKRTWLPLVVVAVVAVGVFAVYRVHGYFGAGNAGGNSVKYEDTKPFNPKVVIYEIWGQNGAMADINYLDLNATPQRVDGASLPWTLKLSTTDPAVSPNIVAQGDGDTIGCRISVDGVVKDERISNGVNAQTFCLVKSG